MENTLVLINKQYVIGKKIGNGSFGEVFQGVDRTDGTKLAIKMEHKSNKHQILTHEYEIYQTIYTPHNYCAPRIYYFGMEGDYRVLVMDMLGHSLESLFNKCGRRFSLKTVLMIADQLIARIEYLHNNYYLHRDIKPENFLTGMGKNNDKIYLIDLGLAKKYRNATKHISYKDGNKLVGTARYASINSHKGIQLSRRDDMESLGYMFIYFLKGGLPWQELDSKTKEEKYAKIKKMKESISLEELCKDIPVEFMNYLKHVKSLEFTSKPDYAYLKGLFTKLMDHLGYVYDLSFDWSKK
jgi:serine/threonine protein kinase